MAEDSSFRDVVGHSQGLLAFRNVGPVTSSLLVQTVLPTLNFSLQGASEVLLEGWSAIDDRDLFLHSLSRPLAPFRFFDLFRTYLAFFLC